MRVQYGYTHTFFRVILQPSAELLTFMGIFSIVIVWLCQTTSQGFLITEAFAAELATGLTFLSNRKFRGISV